MENWTAWEENEAAQLMTFLGLDYPGEQLKCAKTLDSLESVFKYQELTTVFVNTRLWKTKHPRKRFQNFRQSCVLSTDRIEIHQSQPPV